MTSEEQRNLTVAAKYIELYNTDIDRFVPECYTSDCEVYAMGGGVIRGHEQFLRVEKSVLRAAPQRGCARSQPRGGEHVILEVMLLTRIEDRTGSYLCGYSHVVTEKS